MPYMFPTTLHAVYPPSWLSYLPRVPGAYLIEKEVHNHGCYFRIVLFYFQAVGILGSVMPVLSAKMNKHTSILCLYKFTFIQCWYRLNIKRNPWIMQDHFTLMISLQSCVYWKTKNNHTNISQISTVVQISTQKVWNTSKLLSLFYIRRLVIKLAIWSTLYDKNK